MSLSPHRQLLLHVLILILGALFVYSGLYGIYENYKTDALDGRGSIVVAKDCTLVQAKTNTYSCTGDFRQSVADYHFLSATVTTHGNYRVNDLISDVYRDTSVKSESPEAQQYIMGAEKRTVLYNAQNIAKIAVGLAVLSLITALLMIQIVRKRIRA